VFFIALCQGQVKFDNSPILIRDVLRKGGVSGAIIYSDKCRPTSIPVPPHVHPPQKAGTTVEVLQDMFSRDSMMEVTQDSGGIVRMAEKGVQIDILQVKIHHIKFDTDHAAFQGPNMAMMSILSSPEIQSFEREHHIAPILSRLEGSMGQGLPAVTGELNDVSLAEALDYVLKTFPGYWLYENCTADDGRRSVHFWFYD
jgi:hypothetical protein